MKKKKKKIQQGSRIPDQHIEIGYIFFNPKGKNQKVKKNQSLSNLCPKKNINLRNKLKDQEERLLCWEI